MGPPWPGAGSNRVGAASGAPFRRQVGPDAGSPASWALPKPAQGARLERFPSASLAPATSPSPESPPMVQLGFVIDHGKCIGCHACTVACKSENEVPLGSFRTWVKYTEEGEFPSVKRNFAVLRCNQCTDAPCMTICPTSALHKLSNGIVDLEQENCIGCKSCMQACPYDALYINPEQGTAEKCHFCAHRVEQDLAPACAVVCPTEAIIPGDFDDPESVVSKLKAQGDLTARKTEAQTKPNVHYREAAEAGLDPGATNAAGGYLWANQIEGDPLDAERFLATAEDQAGSASGAAGARTTYDVDHQPWWGNKVSAYLLTKSASAGLFLVALAWLNTDTGRFPEPLGWLLPLLASLFLVITSALLILDLKRPERFMLILLRPNWSSWLVKGSIALGGYGALLGAAFLSGVLGIYPPGTAQLALVTLTAVFALFAAIYTAWLFRQAKGRVLWMKHGLELNLAAQALIAGASLWSVIGALMGLPLETVVLLGAIGCGAELLLGLVEPALSPKGRQAEFKRAVALVHAGPFASRHKASQAGYAIAAVLFLASSFAGWGPLAAVTAAGIALVALANAEDVFVRAGQALPIS